MTTRLQHAIETYLHAKDTNRPHRMTDAFTADAELTMTVDTADIAFPPAVSGVAAIAATLSGDFAQRYENVYTFCIGAPPQRDDRFECDWLVCMTDKQSGAARLGFGRYDWRSADGSGRVSHLRITIARMLTLPSGANSPLLAWALRLPYPWCPREALHADAPALDAVRQTLAALA
ncbi:hypothetical protein [Burkholderia alba]|uniref:hypothetical protein n=1 Tax=Burkholderia alba TaxID=2683677 RepID=UPI002B05CF55|nr:hypothetical protein [Burkholderia alba]